jgi:isopentenyl phosphate kinase
MAKLLLVKLGGSLITNKGKDFCARPRVISRLGKEIKLAKKNFPGKIIIAHGSGSFGHSVAAKFEIKDGFVNNKSLVGLPLVADAAIQINRIVMEQFLKLKLPVVSFAPASMVFSSNKKLRQINSKILYKALEIGMLPVLYGDVVFDEKQGFCIYSSEMMLSILAKEAQPNFSDIKIIYCGNTDGIYDSSGKTIPQITPRSFRKLKRFITGSDQTDVTGGMLHKAEESLVLAKKGVETNIVNGNRVGELKKAILGKKTLGTMMSPD